MPVKNVRSTKEIKRIGLRGRGVQHRKGTGTPRGGLHFEEEKVRLHLNKEIVRVAGTSVRLPDPSNEAAVMKMNEIRILQCRQNACSTLVRFQNEAQASSRLLWTWSKLVYDLVRHRSHPDLSHL
ncbi:hypothetical protein BDQ17DRAFT_1328551 [Cyathus striatus]|nr:hypothetical protein BDQ17DRAFT_1328551 [Cyathus striatus]